jgi:hypothetical protein
MRERLRLVAHPQPALPKWSESAAVRATDRKKVIRIRSPVDVLLENASKIERHHRFGWTRCVVWAIAFAAALLIAGLLCWGLSL